MPPKRKATSPPTGGKLIKTKSPVNKDSIPALVKDDDFEKPSSGKNLDNNKLDKKGFCCFTAKHIPPDSGVKNNDIKESEFPNLALNQYLKQKTRINMQGSFKWKIYMFPPPPKSASLPKTPMAYFGLDLVDVDKGRTHWAHKPQVWENLFSSIFEMEKTGVAEPISSVFDGILSCPV